MQPHHGQILRVCAAFAALSALLPGLIQNPQKG